MVFMYNETRFKLIQQKQICLSSLLIKHAINHGKQIRNKEKFHESLSDRFSDLYGSAH